MVKRDSCSKCKAPKKGEMCVICKKKEADCICFEYHDDGYYKYKDEFESSLLDKANSFKGVHANAIEGLMDILKYSNICNECSKAGTIKRCSKCMSKHGRSVVVELFEWILREKQLVRKGKVIDGRSGNISKATDEEHVIIPMEMFKGMLEHIKSGNEFEHTSILIEGLRRLDSKGERYNIKKRRI